MADAPWAPGWPDMGEPTTSMAIRVAATLRVADHISAGTTRSHDIAEAVGADPDGLLRVLWHLAAIDVLRAAGPDVFELTDLGKELCEQGRGVPRRRPAPTTPAGRLHGAAARASALIEGYDWGTVEHVVDVGGGNGTLLVELLTAHPHLRGTVVGRPGPIDTAGRRPPADAGPAEAAGASAQGFFAPPPTGGTVYLLSGVLHDWNDADAGRVLFRCAEAATAAGPAGRVLVLESLVAGGDPRPGGTGTGPMSLVATGGRARSARDLVDLATLSGLVLTSTTAPRPPHSLLEFAPRRP